MGKVVAIHPDVTDFLENLIQILFKKEYFGFEDSAQNYVSKIYDFIENDLINFLPKNLSDLAQNMFFINPMTIPLGIFSLKIKIIAIWPTYITNNHTIGATFL